MASRLLNIAFNFEKCMNTKLPLLMSVRHGHRTRGKPPGIARTLEQRLAVENPIDPEVTMKINIGFPQLKPSRSEQLKERLELLKKQRKNPEFEQKSRNQSLEIDLNAVNDEWLKSSGPFHIRDIANHYGIYQHLFGDAYFVPRVPLHILYEQPDDYVMPVYFGNVITPTDASKQPEVVFDSKVNLSGTETHKKETLWCLLMTNPDGHLNQENQEYLHWFIGNIPNGDISKGDQIASYLQPIPPRGTGFHRHIFILYKQEKRIDFSSYSIKNANNLNERTFRTLDFYRKYQDDITPAGLAFFQSDWDQNLTKVYHDILNIKEPIYEYDFPKPYVKEQTWFPLREPFNLYLDKYRDEKEIAKEFILRKLAKTHPFNGPEKPLRYPNAHPIKGIPSWLKTEKKKARLQWGRVNDY